MKRILLLLVPLVVLAGLLGVFAVSLNRDPHLIPSVLINKPAPDFALPPVQGLAAQGFDTDMLKGVDAEKAAPGEVARRIVAALAAGDSIVFPDDASAGAGEVYRTDPLGLEQMLAG